MVSSMQHSSYQPDHTHSQRKMYFVVKRFIFWIDSLLFRLFVDRFKSINWYLYLNFCLKSQMYVIFELK